MKSFFTLDKRMNSLTVWSSCVAVALCYSPLKAQSLCRVVIFCFVKLSHKWFRELSGTKPQNSTAFYKDNNITFGGINTPDLFASPIWVTLSPPYGVRFSVRSLLGRFDRGLGSSPCGESWWSSSHVTSSHTLSWHSRSSWPITHHLSVSPSWFWSSHFNRASASTFWPRPHYLFLLSVSLPSSVSHCLFFCLSLSANFRLLKSLFKVARSTDAFLSIFCLFLVPRLSWIFDTGTQKWVDTSLGFDCCETWLTWDLTLQTSKALPL